MHPWRSSSWPWPCRAMRRAPDAPPPRFGATRRAPGAPPPRFGAPGHGVAGRRSISGASPPQLPALVLISGGPHLRPSAADETRPAAVPARRPWLPPPLSPASPAPPSSSLPPSHGGTSRVVGRPVRRGVSRSASKRARDGVCGTERDGPVPFPGRRCAGGDKRPGGRFPVRFSLPVRTV
jgi:hypothetical protein